MSAAILVSSAGVIGGMGLPVGGITHAFLFSSDRVLYLFSLAASIQRRILSPSGMARTTFEIEAMLADADHAWRHNYDGYAMGWFTLPDYRGMRALSHDGNL